MAVAFGHVDLLHLVAVIVEQAQNHAGGMAREDRKVDPIAIIAGA